jgi:hypothetical protein
VQPYAEREVEITISSFFARYKDCLEIGDTSMNRAAKLTFASVLTATIILTVGPGRPSASHISLKQAAPGALYNFDDIVNNSLASARTSASPLRAIAPNLA